ncbi:MAG: antA/AntB antirepressor family protein, partial [Pseudomonadota bacterium]|nr:antA/AntB antirepressor family protein [Pseudomonadota bacterium]
ARRCRARAKDGKFYNYLHYSLDAIRILLPKKEKQTGRGGHNATRCVLSLDCAKQIAMVQNNPDGQLVGVNTTYFSSLIGPPRGRRRLAL